MASNCAICGLEVDKTEALYSPTRCGHVFHIICAKEQYEYKTTEKTKSAFKYACAFCLTSSTSFVNGRKSQQLLKASGRAAKDDVDIIAEKIELNPASRLSILTLSADQSSEKPGSLRGMVQGLTDTVNALRSELIKQGERVKRLSNQREAEWKNFSESVKVDVSAIRENVDSLLQQVQTFSGTLENVQADVVAHGVRLDAVETRVDEDVKSLRTRVEALERSIQPSGRTDIDLQRRMLYLESDAVASHVVVSGLPEIPGEQLSATFTQLCRLLEVPIPPNPVLRAERLGRRRTDGRSRAALFVLTSRQFADGVIKAKRTSGRILASQLDRSLGDTQLSVGRRIVPMQHYLRAEVLRKVPNIQPRSVWFGDSCVMVRKDGNQRPFPIQCPADIGRLIQ